MGRIGINWVTDRLPTDADSDEDGDVMVRCRPDSDDWNWVHWEDVCWPGTPWASPPDEKANSVNAVTESSDLAAFGDWWDRYTTGINAKALPAFYQHIIRSTAQIAWSNAALNARRYPVPVEVNFREADDGTRHFVSITRTIDINGEHILDAIANDGTAWWNRPSEGTNWVQITPLP